MSLPGNPLHCLLGTACLQSSWHALPWFVDIAPCAPRRKILCLKCQVWCCGAMDMGMVVDGTTVWYSDLFFLRCLSICKACFTVLMRCIHCMLVVCMIINSIYTYVNWSLNETVACLFWAHQTGFLVNIIMFSPKVPSSPNFNYIQLLPLNLQKSTLKWLS